MLRQSPGETRGKTSIAGSSVVTWVMGLLWWTLSELPWVGITAPPPEGQARRHLKLPAQAGTKLMLSSSCAEQLYRWVLQGHARFGGRAARCHPTDASAWAAGRRREVRSLGRCALQPHGCSPPRSPTLSSSQARRDVISFCLSNTLIAGFSFFN